MTTPNSTQTIGEFRTNIDAEIAADNEETERANRPSRAERRRLQREAAERQRVAEAERQRELAARAERIRQLYQWRSDVAPQFRRLVWRVAELLSDTDAVLNYSERRNESDPNVIRDIELRVAGLPHTLELVTSDNAYGTAERVTFARARCDFGHGNRRRRAFRTDDAMERAAQHAADAWVAAIDSQRRRHVAEAEFAALRQRVVDIANAAGYDTEIRSRYNWNVTDRDADRAAFSINSQTHHGGGRFVLDLFRLATANGHTVETVRQIRMTRDLVVTDDSETQTLTRERHRNVGRELDAQGLAE